jgi:molybdenum cofactor cytidylyltransferase
MKFGAIPLSDAEGAILAHTHRLPGRVLRKGLMLDAAALAALRAAGHTKVVAARLEADDVGEDDAAGRLGAALVASPLLTASAASTGRVNLFAARPGLLRVAAETVHRLNAVDEALTLATLPDAAMVAARAMVATIKVIPFAVPGDRLAEAEALLRDAPPALTLHPFRPLRAGLVLTELPGLKPSMLEGTIAATAARIAGFGGTLLPPLACPHDAAAIAEALRTLLARGAELLLIAGASAVADRRDVAPEGITRAGGAIEHFGMPVDPGNLLCLGRIGAVPALVLPGCARSPRPNGIDAVLARLFAGLPVTRADIAGMGVGGLLQEGDPRPLPRALAGAPHATAGSAVAAIVLAAGLSRRMAPRNKLLLPDANGQPMVARVVDAALASAARPVLVVLGHQAEAVKQALAGRPVRFVHAADYAEGLSASLKAGLAALPESACGAMICLGDMPLVTAPLLDRLLAAFAPEDGRRIVVPMHAGRRGNPVIWDRSLFPEILASVRGDNGARFVLERHADEIVEVEMVDDSVLRDFDTPDSLDLSAAS